MRAYLAIGGGIDTPAALGSRATYLRGRLGGRARARARAIGCRSARPPPSRLRRVRSERRPDYATEPEVQVVLGPQDDRFTARGIAAFLEGAVRDDAAERPDGRAAARAASSSTPAVTTSSRTACRWAASRSSGDGQPIVLLVDRQSTGGYTKIATVCSFDIGRVGQVKPGQRLRFRRVDAGAGARGARVRRELLDTAIEAR